MAKIGSSNAVVWEATAGLRNARATAMTRDYLGNIFVTGNIEGLNDVSDIATAKFGPGGGLSGVLFYDGQGNDEEQLAASVATDAFGGLFVAGVRWKNSVGQLLTLKYSYEGSRSGPSVSPDPLSIG